MKRQTTIPFMGPEPSVLVLSIRPEHVARILNGTKRFELRKQLPRSPFNRVFMYETGGIGLTGCFDVLDAARLPIEELWRHVGELATTRTRFDEYFKGWDTGCYIEIANPIRFETPVTSLDLKKQIPQFTAPQSYLVVTSENPLYALLNRLGSEGQPRTALEDLLLRPIARDEARVYEIFVRQEISKSYDEIDASFARANLENSASGYDPFALLTIRKEVLSIERVDGTLIGFTTLTYKLGGSVKSGPTILMPEHRGLGYGARLRKMVEAMLRAEGARKLYTTAPDSSESTISYLLKSGMTIEAHLEGQYSTSHGELVLGKILSSAAMPSPPSASYDSRAGQVVGANELTLREKMNGIELALAAYGVRTARSRLKEIASKLDLQGGYSQKPRSIVVLKSAGTVVAAIVLSAKRGGAIRGVMGCTTSHTPSIMRLIHAAEDIARSAGRRKLYYAQANEDKSLVSAFRETGYRTEGILREPYESGKDLLVLSKFLRSAAE